MDKRVKTQKTWGIFIGNFTKRGVEMFYRFCKRSGLKGSEVQGSPKNLSTVTPAQAGLNR